MTNWLDHPVMNGLDNAAITEVLNWKIKFPINESFLSRKSSPKFYFQKRIMNVREI